MDTTSTSTKPHAKAEERFKVNTKKIITITIVLFLVAAAAIGFIGWKADIFTSVDALRGLLESIGALAPLVFLLIHVLQIIIPIIPGGVTLAVGIVAFGPVYGFVYNYLGLAFGSTLAFLVSRRFGMPLIKCMVSGKTFDKYVGWLDKSQLLFNKLFAVAIFLPFFPDDILCMLAGVSKMKLSTFLLINSPSNGRFCCRIASAFQQLSVGWAYKRGYLMRISRINKT